MSKRKPSDIRHWTAYLDVNMLRDDEAAIVSKYNIDEDAQLDALVEEWLRPNFLEENKVTQKSLREILDCLLEAPIEEVSAALTNFGMPTGETVRDVPRFLAALKRAARAN